jgi:hypothetical protein
MNHKLKMLAVGCSFTKGHGLAHSEHDKLLWVNRLADGIDANVTNLSITGANNHLIFLTASTAIVENHYDIVLIGWSVIPRYNIQVGLELYPTTTMLKRNGHDVDINNKKFSHKWLSDIGDRLNIMHNDHWQILDLVKYINILIHLQKNYKHGKLFFVNALCPWTTGYFEYKNISIPSQLDQYQQKMLRVETRNDDEIINLYNMTHAQYNQFGGIQSDHWLNLYRSLQQLQVDTVSASDKHPGYSSQQQFVDHLLPELKTKLNIE